LDSKKPQLEDYKNMKNYQHYILFSDLLRYPSKDYTVKAQQCFSMLEKNYPEAAEEIKPFIDYVYSHSEDEREELFTKTFDVQPICYLDLGYVIFGEDYKRGAFLLHMQEEQLLAGNDCGTDLSDNICNILTLYTKTDNQALLDELAVKILIPGLEKMIGEFKQARVELKMKVLKKLHRAIIQEELNQGNVYRNVFTAFLFVMKKDFENVSYLGILDPIVDVQHHKSFFGKQSVNIEVNKSAEAQNIVSLHKLD
jgi:nitrate reductase assembly molybdenum cofactor insertion protein NarJ